MRRFLVKTSTIPVMERRGVMEKTIMVKISNDTVSPGEVNCSGSEE